MRWVHGALQGAISREHLQDYLSEFEFRFNRRHARKPGLLFYRLMEQAVFTDAITYQKMKACTVPTRKTPTQAPTGPRSRSLDQKDAGRPWRQIVR